MAEHIDLQAGASFDTTATTDKVSGTQNQQRQQFNKAEPQLTGLAALAQLGALTASGNTASGSLADIMKIMKTVDERIRDKQNNLKVTITAVEDSRLCASAICLSIVHEGTLFYVGILPEALAKPLTTQTIPYQGKNIEVDVVTAQYWDPTMKHIAVQSIMANTTVQVIKTVDVAGIVIQKGIDLTNPDNLAPFYDYAISALKTYQLNDQKLPLSPLTAAILGDATIQLVERIEVNPGATYITTTGDVMAGDFTAVLLARNPNGNKTNQPNISLHREMADIGLAGITVEVDFMRVPPNQVSGMQQNPSIPGYTPACPGYIPVLIVTQNTALKTSDTSYDSLITQCLGLTLLVPMVDESNPRWINVFEPFISEGRFKTSIGTMALEHNPFPYPGVTHEPKVITIVGEGDPSVGGDRLTAKQMAETFCLKNCVIALDIVHGGPLEWVQAAFAAAEPGSATEAIICDQLNYFSGGVWNSIWDRKSSILAQKSTRVHIGYYLDQAGNKRDIRSIDYLAMLETSGGNPELFYRFTQGFLPGTDSQELMAQKRAVYNNIIPNITYTSIATRIFFNNAFISAMDDMMKRCGLAAQIEGINDINGQLGRINLNSSYFTPIRSHGTFGFARQNQVAGNGPNRYQGFQGFGSGNGISSY